MKSSGRTPTLGQALRRPAEGSGRPAGLRRGGHRRQGLHVRHLQRSGRPPTLISFAIAPIRAGEVLSPEFKEAGHPVYLFAPPTAAPRARGKPGRPSTSFAGRAGVCSAWAVEHGIAEGIMQMSFGNSIGFQAEGREIAWDLPCPGAIVAELTEDTDLLCAVRLGTTTAEPVLTTGADSVSIDEPALPERVRAGGCIPQPSPCRSCAGAGTGGPGLLPRRSPDRHGKAKGADSCVSRHQLRVRQRPGGATGWPGAADPGAE